MGQQTLKPERNLVVRILALSLTLIAGDLGRPAFVSPELTDLIARTIAALTNISVHLPLKLSRGLMRCKGVDYPTRIIPGTTYLLDSSAFKRRVIDNCHDVQWAI